MNQFQKTLSWLDDNYGLAYSLTRMFLGAALFVRGYLLVTNPDAFIESVGNEISHIWLSYVTMCHLIGGFSIMVGILCRLAAILQIPILTSAIFLVHAKQGLMMGDQSLELASLVLFLLILVLFFGRGPLSLGNFIKAKLKWKSLY